MRGIFDVLSVRGMVGDSSLCSSASARRFGMEAESFCNEVALAVVEGAAVDSTL